LLDNIGNLTGTNPYIRVGGNTQDYAIYNPSQTEGAIGIYEHPSDDYPNNITIGPAFFESYLTWSKTKFTHGFNLKAAGTTFGANSLTQSVVVACNALGNGNLLWWEYGNEPDRYIDSDSTYISRWLNGTRSIKASIGKACPSMAKSPNYGWISPSLASTGGKVGGSAFEAGLDVDKDIKLISMHLYVATNPKSFKKGLLTFYKLYGELYRIWRDSPRDVDEPRSYRLGCRCTGQRIKCFSLHWNSLYTW
jgi:hypothetical protein